MNAPDDCELCGELLDDELMPDAWGEHHHPTTGRHVTAHAQCAADHGYTLA